MLQFTKNFQSYLKKWDINYTCNLNIYSYNYEFENNIKVLARHTVDEKNFAIYFTYKLESLYCPTNKKLDILNFCNKWNSKKNDLFVFLCPVENALILTRKITFYEDNFPLNAAYSIFLLYPEIIQEFYTLAVKTKIFNKEYTPKIIPSNPEKAPKKEKISTSNLVYNIAANDVSYMGYSFIQENAQNDNKKKQV